MNKFFYIIIALCVVMFASCNADFDPNDEWRENMIIYCLLDQDEDTTWVRVEKGFLGGNAIENAKQKDSIYYNKEDLDVKLYAYNVWNENELKEVFDFTYTTTNKQNGDFYSSTSCPIYYCVTKGKLSPYYIYKLVVTNTKTNTTATSKTKLIGDYKIENNNFTFTEKGGAMKIVWSNNYNTQEGESELAKLFSVSIRFNYTENGRVQHIDIPVCTRTNDNKSFSLSTLMDTATMFSSMRLQLKDKQHLGWYATRPFEIRVSAGDLDMFDYISINNTQNTLTYTSVYSNIDGAIGLFSARRNNIYKGFADKNIPNQIKAGVMALGCFE